VCSPTNGKGLLESPRREWEACCAEEDGDVERAVNVGWGEGGRGVNVEKGMNARTETVRG